MKRVLWTCDKCGHGESLPEHGTPKDRDFYEVVVTVAKAPMGIKTRPASAALWCADCCTKMKALPAATKAGEEKPTPPTLEDLVYEIASEAASARMDH